MADAMLKGATVIDQEGSRLGVLSRSVDDLTNMLLPWLSDKNTNSNVNSLKTKADRWEAMFGDKE